MSEFDARARDWDNNPIHWERSEAIANNLIKMIPVTSGMKAMEYGAGTGILSFLLSEYFSEITLMDNSREMVQVMHEKVLTSKVKNLIPLLFDLEHSEYRVQKFDCIFTQMVLHHVADTRKILDKFYQLLNPGGYIAIADLYPEDGTFHGDGFIGHKGFDLVNLQNDIEIAEFTQFASRQVYTIKKNIDNTIREYPIFLLVASKE